MKLFTQFNCPGFIGFDMFFPRSFRGGNSFQSFINGLKKILLIFSFKSFTLLSLNSTIMFKHWSWPSIYLIILCLNSKNQNALFLLATVFGQRTNVSENRPPSWVKFLKIILLSYVNFVGCLKTDAHLCEVLSAIPRKQLHTSVKSGNLSV